MIEQIKHGAVVAWLCKGHLYMMCLTLSILHNTNGCIAWTQSGWHWQTTVVTMHVMPANNQCMKQSSIAR